MSPGNIPDGFEEAMKAPVRELQGFIKTDNYNITSENDLMEFRLTGEIELLSTAMRKVEFKVYGDYNLINQWVEVGCGVRLPDASYTYISYGNFLVVEQSFIKDEGVSKFVAYDKMILLMKPYQPLEVEYPISISEYIDAILEKAGFDMGNTHILTEVSLEIERELWTNINGITYRDVLEQIAQATGLMFFVGEDNILQGAHCGVYWPEHQISPDELINCKIGDAWGPINSLVLARTPQEDNIFYKDDEAVEQEGLFEYRIENNEILDPYRYEIIQDLYNVIKGDYPQYNYECTTTGLGYISLCDEISVYYTPWDGIYSRVHSIDILFDGGIKEIIKGFAPTITQTQYKYASPISKRLKNTEIVVNKQDQYIKQLVSDMYEENGIINENFTEIHQDINNIITSIQASGGINLIKNSVMFAYNDENIPSEWTISGSGTLDIKSSIDSLSNGCLSGNVFILNNKTAKQRIKVSRSDENNKIYYSFSTKIKKDLNGTCYVKLYNEIDEYIINVSALENPEYEEYKLDSVTFNQNYVDLEFFGSADSNATFTDNILCLGTNSLNWQQADGELMNTQVNINKDGVLVKSSIYAGDYTIMSPLEFAGYSNLNGAITKVFSLNKDTTTVKKLNAEDNIKMDPIKIVPVTSGDLQGWAFVPTTNEEVSS